MQRPEEVCDAGCASKLLLSAYVVFCADGASPPTTITGSEMREAPLGPRNRDLFASNATIVPVLITPLGDSASVAIAGAEPTQLLSCFAAKNRLGHPRTLG